MILHGMAMNWLAAVNILEKMSLPSYKFIVAKLPLIRINLPKSLKPQIASLSSVRKKIHQKHVKMFNLQSEWILILD